MTFDTRFVVVVLAAFACANTVAACVAVWQWRHREPPAAPQDRAAFLFRIRLLPIVASLLWATLAMSSFFLFEPRGVDESIGIVLFTLALAGAALLASGVVRLVTTLTRHRRIVRGWLANAEPVTLAGVTVPSLVVQSSFPIVAVIGVFRPRLVIAQSVLDACTAEELAAVLAHEVRHLTRRDNIRRTLLISLPDPLGWLAVGREIDLAWHDATEEVADEAPGQDRGDAGRVALASALIRVAKMVPAGQAPAEIPASALYRGEPLERRVRRLLDPIPPRPRAPRHHQWLGLAAFIILSIVLLNPIHELLEVAVTFLP